MQVRCIACIGGTDVRESVRLLQEGGHQIVVGTPGRVFDMISKRHLGKLRG